MPPKPTVNKPENYLNVEQRRERANRRDPANLPEDNERQSDIETSSTSSYETETSSEEEEENNQEEDPKPPLPPNVRIRDEQNRINRREREQREANEIAIRILENQIIQQGAAQAIREQEQIDRDARAGVQAIQDEAEARRQRLRERDERRVQRMNEALEATQEEMNRRNPCCSIQ